MVESGTHEFSQSTTRVELFPAIHKFFDDPETKLRIARIQSNIRLEKDLTYGNPNGVYPQRFELIDIILREPGPPVEESALREAKYASYKLPHQ